METLEENELTPAGRALALTPAAADAVRQAAADIPADLIKPSSWSVDLIPGKSPYSKVILRYFARAVMTGSGKIFYDNALEAAAHFERTGYVPSLPAGKCLADLSPGQRQAVCLPLANNDRKCSGVKPKAK